MTKAEITKIADDVYRTCSKLENRFLWDFPKNKKLDLGLIEIQLNSLWNRKNINLSEDAFDLDLRSLREVDSSAFWTEDGESLLPGVSLSDFERAFSNSFISLSSPSIKMALDTFKLSFSKALEAHGIIVEPQFEPWTEIAWRQLENDDDYETMSHYAYLGADSKGYDHEMMSYGGPLHTTTTMAAESRGQSLWIRWGAVFSLLRKDCHITFGGAYKAMLRNLVSWERNVVMQAMRQLSEDIGKSTQ